MAEPDEPEAGPGDGPATAGGRRPTGSVAFDPLAALTDTHRLAIETAQASFRSFARAVGDGRDGGGFGARRTAGEQPDGGGDHDDGRDDGLDAISFADLRRTVTRSLDLYLELAERLMDTATRSLEDTLRARGVTATGGRREQPWTPVAVEARPGEVASAPIWLHNMTPDAVASVTFVPTDLTAYDGSVLPAACLSVDPPSLTDVSPRRQRVGRPSASGSPTPSRPAPTSATCSSARCPGSPCRSASTSGPAALGPTPAGPAADVATTATVDVEGALDRYAALTRREMDRYLPAVDAVGRRPRHADP